jgi:hypothetical protein
MADDINVQRIAELSVNALKIKQRYELIMENIRRVAKGKEELPMDESAAQPQERKVRRSRTNVEVINRAPTAAEIALKERQQEIAAQGDVAAPIVRMVDHDADRVDPAQSTESPGAGDGLDPPDFLKRGALPGAAIPATAAAYEQALKS